MAIMAKSLLVALKNEMFYKKKSLQFTIYTAIYLRNTYISYTISRRYILIAYKDFYILFQAFPVIPLANFVHSSIDATVASMSLSYSSVTIFWYICVSGGIYTNAPVSIIIDHSYRHFYEVL